MPTRIFTAQPLHSTHSITLDEAASAHVARVLRMKPNDPLIIFNGEGGEWHCRITDVKPLISLKLIRFHDISRESPCPIHLAQGITRGDKLDFIFQKATELGVTEITPLICEQSTGKIPKERMEKKLNRLNSIIYAACEQSGRTSIPKLNGPCTVSEFIAEDPGELITFYPQADQELKNMNVSSRPLAVMIGPEGDFSHREIELIRTAGGQLVQFGPRILRTETAAPAALAAIQHRFGDMR